jgi:hypothetical protein
MLPLRHEDLLETRDEEGKMQRTAEYATHRTVEKPAGRLMYVGGS